MSVTINEIARECGVSIATVSRVLNGSRAVAPLTRERVQEAIDRQGYSPNALARSLVAKHSMTLGVVAPDITNPYFSAVFSEIERAALSADYSVILCNTFYASPAHAQQQGVKSEEEYFQIMMEKKVDGVLIIGGQIDLAHAEPSYQNALKRLAKALPTVVMGKPLPGVGCVFIERETGSGVSTAVNHLVSLGHSRIAFVGGEDGVNITETRLAAYRGTLAALGLPHGDELISLSDYYIEDGYMATLELLNRNTSFTSVLAINDNVALGAVRAFADRGLAVPRDIALVSCDQFFFAGYSQPRLTSIDQHNRQFGMLAIQILLCAIKGISEPVKLNYTPELIVRESCGGQLRKGAI
ncbi:MAG: LacI family transcriptional regulator [Clostridiales bacterium]|nr:LacI family transcriptional regulator [Clostridiales bacterium]